MRTEIFKAWLEDRYLNKNAVVINTLSRCKKVELYYGDLDKKFRKDRCWGVIDELNYTTKDEKADNLPKHKIPIGGNIKNSSASYKNAVKLYLAFCLFEKDNPYYGISVRILSEKSEKIISVKNESKLQLRKIDVLFKTTDDLDQFFVKYVVGFSKYTADIKNYRILAHNYFLSVEGMWFIKDLETNIYTKIVPSEIDNSTKIEYFFDELFRRNERNLIDYLKEKWLVENYINFEDAKEDDDIRTEHYWIKK